jgi:hypothetical protein
MLSSKNPQSKEINQKRGPTTGNTATGSKRKDFMAEKDTRSSEKAGLANMVTSALEMRGRGVQAKVDPALEGLHSDTGPKRNPTADGSKLPSKYKK